MVDVVEILDLLGKVRARVAGHGKANGAAGG
jgi:hypothetical protein